MSARELIAKSKISIQIGKDEASNWFQDYMVIGLDKLFFSPDEVISKFQEPQDLSHEVTVWKLKTQEQEDILLFSKKNVQPMFDNESCFKHFVRINCENPEYRNRFVAFVNDTFQDVDDVENRLVKKMYEKFGNIEMFVGKVSMEEEKTLIDTPEFK